MSDPVEALRCADIAIELERTGFAPSAATIAWQRARAADPTIAEIAREQSR